MRVDQANASGRVPAVFVNGLWLLASSWDRWAALFALNRSRAIALTYEQFRYGFANAVGEDEAKELYDMFAVPAPVTEIVEIENRGHALTIDGGWREVAERALAFVKRFAPPSDAGTPT
jgi:hypothetical protein